MSNDHQHGNGEHKHDDHCHATAHNFPRKEVVAREDPQHGTYWGQDARLSGEVDHRPMSRHPCTSYGRNAQHEQHEEDEFILERSLLGLGQVRLLQPRQKDSLDLLPENRGGMVRAINTSSSGIASCVANGDGVRGPLSLGRPKVPGGSITVGGEGNPASKPSIHLAGKFRYR
eukprot:CAMPEP_0179144512 /NCGR_PEP_ID=MMETSP0796-20121207/69632_1 /TAXON_ID=73915 /ORGANISM="Pyrodinium bahamense, Strain pbaha01" /LENGTH=172 /DNA_ID=CAMNT_0020844753 /DNA_START=500 /DNA_END=1016 /DNA_ORIENTATION=+